MSSSTWRKLVVAGALALGVTAGAGVAVVAQAGGGNELPPGQAAPRAGITSPSESVFVPITPCRVVNTATSGAGKIAAGVTRAYETQGNTSSQGGAAACGIPSTATALEVNITAPSASGNGYLRVAPAGVAIPNATFMNYTSSFNVSNAGTVRIAPGTGNNLQVRAYNSATHVVIDVLGYYVSELHASVSGNGTVARGNGVVTTNSRDTTGTYRVNFDRDIRGCAFNATLGNPASGSPDPGTITATPNAFNNNGIYVETFNAAGTAADRAFHISVDC